MTPFALHITESNRWNTEEGASIIQKTGESRFLITGRTVPGNTKGDYTLVLVQDISEIYTDIRHQVMLAIFLYAGGAVLAVLLIFLSTKKYWLLCKVCIWRQRISAAEDWDGASQCRPGMKSALWPTLQRHGRSNPAAAHRAVRSVQTAWTDAGKPCPRTEDSHDFHHWLYRYIAPCKNQRKSAKAGTDSHLSGKPPTRETGQ